MMLLERENLLADLSGLLLQAESQGGRLLFLGGEAGIGKSALLRTFSKAADPRVLIGACDSLSTPRPLGPLLDMAVDGDIGLDRHAIVNSSRDEVFATFLEHLTAAAEPLIVVFEDVHWADETTLDLLRYLGRRLDQTKVLLIASYRDDEIGPAHPVRMLMGDLATSPNYRRMHLTRLSPAAVRELTADSDIDPEELYRLTSGNPFYATEVLASGERGVPVRISDAVLARAARLSPESRAVLDVCAVIGFRFEPGLVSTVVGPDTDLAAAFEECTAAGVLVANERTMAFRHELARDALLAVISFARKQALHKRVLEVLVANGSSDLSSLAHHAEGALEQEAVLEFAMAAGRSAANAGAHRQAAAQFARALRFADGLPAPERAWLLEAYAAEHVLTDQPGQVDEAYREAIALRKQIGDERGRVVDLVRLSQNLGRQGRNHESDEAADLALRLLEKVPAGPEHAFARVNRAYLKMLDRDNQQAVVDGLRAIELAREFHDVNSLLLAYNVVGSSQILLGKFAEGESNLTYCLRLGKRLGIDNAVAGAYGNLGSAFGEMYRFEEAKDFLRAGIPFSRTRDLDFQANYMDAWLATTLMFNGEWAESAELAADVLRRSGGAAITRIMALVALGRVRARRGDPDVWTVLDEALDLASKTGTLQRIGPVRAARAEAAFLAGHHEQAAQEALAGYELAVMHDHPWHVGELGYWRRLAEQERAEPGLAEPELADPRPDDAGSGDQRLQALSFTAEPYALEAAGDWAAAAAAWEELGCPYEAARALSAATEQEPLERARVAFERLGAPPPP